jgi:uncharacterized RDD family membrane protein YckC
MEKLNRVGIGARVINCVVDNLLIFLIAYIAYIILKYAPLTYYRFMYYKVWLVTIGFYYLFFEGIFARTPGKWLSLSVVKTKMGKRPNLGHVLLRTAVRYTLIDAFFIPFLEEALHDRLSGTQVVEA